MPLALLLGGCGALSTPMGTGGPIVAGHLGYMKGYLESGATERARMVRQLEAMPLDEDGQSRLRYAILLSLDTTDQGQLKQSLEMLEALRGADELTPAERWLAQLWHDEVANRLYLSKENADVRVALEEAQDKLEQLTVIEEELEADDNGTEQQQ